MNVDARLLKKSYGDSTGPLGFPMQSAAARELESLLKGLSTQCRDLGLMRICPEVKAVDLVEGEHADISFVTTNSVDRDREVVLPGGGDWKQFSKSPVVTFAHDYSALPIGKAAWVKRDTKKGTDGWLAKTIYKSRPADHPAAAEWFPDTVWSFVADGMLSGKSIGFIALNYRPPEEKEIKANPSYAKARGVIDKWMALEYAVTPVQSNPDALVLQVAKMRRKGMVADEFLERAGLVVPEEMPPVEPEREIKFSVIPPLDIAGLFRKRAAETIANIDPRAVFRRELSKATGRI